MVNTKKLISVIMLTYNREQYVKRAIESILKQTYEHFEFIIVDNGSSDTSGKIADEYAQIDERIKVIHRDRGNIGAGRNTGLDVAIGDYITFIDDDDYVISDYLDFLYNLITKDNADISICGSSSKSFDLKITMTAEEAIKSLLWRKYYNVGFPTKLFKKQMFSGIRFPETGKYDDIYLMPKLIAKSRIVVYHGLPKYIIERHDNNNSAWTQNHQLLTANIIMEYLNVYEERTEWLCKIFPNETDTWNYFNWSFMISMVEKINRFNIPNCENVRERMITELKKNKDIFVHSTEIHDFEKKWMQLYI